MKTTLHNHIKLGDENKPLIPNVIFKSLLILCEHNDFEACDYIIKCYTLAPSQKIMYEQSREIVLNKTRQAGPGAATAG